MPISTKAFFQLVLARLVEPTSKLDSLRVINELGITPSHHNTYYKALKRCAGRDYRSQLATAYFQHVWGQFGLRVRRAEMLQDPPLAVLLLHDLHRHRTRSRLHLPQKRAHNPDPTDRLVPQTPHPNLPDKARRPPKPENQREV
ncbi:MAG: hypothetical protein QM619_04950 [Micropruina sp.]|uniref:hypothetical protein n=1 Tax=Micropruina sp. TaxID=2737536 RepID=UPI0039E3732A